MVMSTHASGIRAVYSVELMDGRQAVLLDDLDRIIELERTEERQAILERFRARADMPCLCSVHRECARKRRHGRRYCGKCITDCI